MQQSIYLDNNATTHVSEFVKRRLHELVDVDPGNPESPHSGGETARRLIADTRLRTANALSTQDDRIVFTASGSESNTHAIAYAMRLLRSQGRLRVVTSRIEHSSIAKGIDVLARAGAEVEYARISPSGVIDIDDLSRAIKEGCDVIYVQWANNETGAVQPIHHIGELSASVGAYFHVDAAQAFGKLQIDAEDCNADTLTVTAHKIHGPKGVAILYAKSLSLCEQVIYGGQQEYGIRGGTHNVLGIGGLGAAIEERFADLDANIKRMRLLRDALEHKIVHEIRGSVVRSIQAVRVPNTTCITFPNVDGAQMIAWLDANGVQCSQTAACRSQRPEPSEVLKSMGLSEQQAYGTIRFSVSPLNTEEEIDKSVSLICRAYRAIAA